MTTRAAVTPKAEDRTGRRRPGEDISPAAVQEPRATPRLLPEAPAEASIPTVSTSLKPMTEGQEGQEVEQTEQENSQNEHEGHKEKHNEHSTNEQQQQ